METNYYIESGKYPLKKIDLLFFMLSPALLISVSGIFLYLIILKNWLINTNSQSITLFVFFLMFLIGVFLLYKLSIINKLKKIESTLSIENKNLILNKLSEKLKFKPQSSKHENCYCFTYSKFFLSPLLTVIFLFDEYGFYFNVLNNYDYSLIDWGATKNLTRKIIDEIENELKLMS